MRAAIQQSGESTATLARRYGLSPSTVMKWRRRNFTHDVSSARHNNPSSISELEEYLLVSLRTDTGLPLDDCHYVMAHYVNAKLTHPSIYRFFLYPGNALCLC